jgi:hypothetical protein
LHGRQKKFVDLNGSTEASGDLKSVVLHSMTMTSCTSDFDVPVGVKMSAVDSSTFGLTGEAYSHIVAPKTSTHAPRVLQKDDVALGARRANSTHHQLQLTTSSTHHQPQLQLTTSSTHHQLNSPPAQLTTNSN